MIAMLEARAGARARSRTHSFSDEDSVLHLAKCDR
jgi:hypothetical protein